MNFKLLTGVLLLVGWFAVGASAQITQDPLDEGFADTMYFVINTPAISATSQTVTAGLYVYNDASNRRHRRRVCLGQLKTEISVGRSLTRSRRGI
jgi:hypothetical protein